MSDATTGTVLFIAVAPHAGAPMQSLAGVQAVAGRGLAGDRYATGTGFYSATPSEGGGREITLIEIESLEAVARETGIAVEMQETRRNLTTRGIRLDQLIGRRFRIGDVLCQGVKRCVPCARLEHLTGKPLLKPLVERGGLRANLLEGGVIRVGDVVAAVEAGVTRV